MRIGNRYEKGAGRTLAGLVNAKMALVAICRRRRVLFPVNYIAQFGEDYLAIERREHLRCSGCCGRPANLHEPWR